MNTPESRSPRLDLPSREEWGLKPEKKPGAGLLVLVVLLLLALLGLEAFQLFRTPAAGTPEVPASSSAAADESLAGIQLHDLATRLQRNNLPGAAARVLEDHLRTLGADEVERRHKTLLTLGNLLARAGRHEEALVRYLQAEALGPGSENQPHIDRQVAEMMRKLGKFDELAYELSDRTGVGTGDRDAGQVVAQIGIEKITASELDAHIARRVDLQLASLGGLPEESRQSYRQQMLAELREPRRRLQVLREMVARKILYREGLEKDLDRNDAVVQQIEEFRRGLVANEVVRERVNRIRLSENDLRLFFQARPERYRLPASARVRVAVLADEKAAAEFLSTAETDEDFARLARERSLDRATGAGGGELSAPVQEGQPLPGLGPAPELVKAIFATGAGQEVPTSFPLGEHHVVARVLEIEPARQPGFEEVRDRVAQDYSRQKEAEAQQELLQELFERHRVTLHTEAIIDVGPAGEAPGEAADGDADEDPDEGSG